MSATIHPTAPTATDAWTPPWGGRRWRRAGVYGLGVSGRAAAELLRRRRVAVVGFDERPAAELELGALGDDSEVAVEAGALPRVLPDDVDALVLSPGVPDDRPLIAAARRRGLPIVAEVELAYRFLAGEVIAITGSNGKSTTTALTGAMLAAAGRQVEICGNIGDALSSRVEGPAGRVFVVELSSFQLEAVDRFHADSAALLNLSADHLDRHGGIDGYRAAKLRVFNRQGDGDLAILGAPFVAAQASQRRPVDLPARVRQFSSQGAVADGCCLDGETVVEVAPAAPTRPLFLRADVPLPGPHNLENAMAAALLALAHGADAAAVRAGLRGFGGLPHRLQRVAEAGGVIWYDDSKGTNPAATARSLEGFADGEVHLILGGRFKGGELGELRKLVTRKARAVYLVGEAEEPFSEAFSGAAPLVRAGTVAAAVDAAGDAAHAGEVVLLSPACSSFDQWPDFAARGRGFQRLVRQRLGLEGAQGGPDGS